MASSKFIEKIKTNSLIKLHPSFEELFVEAGLVQFYAAGETVIKQGEKLEHLIIPIDDTLKMLHMGIDTKEKTIGYLQPGRSLLLRNLLSSKKASYGVRTDSPGSVLKVPRDKFIEHIAQFDGMEEYLRMMTLSSGIREFKRFLESLDISLEVIMKIFKNFSTNVSKVPARKMYKPKKQLYFCARGQYQLVKEDATFQLFESSWWGGETALNTDLGYILRTQTDCYFHKLDAEILKKLLPQDKLDRIFRDPFLKKFSFEKNLTTLDVEDLERQLSRSEEKYVDQYIDKSLLAKTNFQEEFYETFAKNFSLLSEIEFDFTCFNLLQDTNIVSLGEIAKIFDILGFQSHQKDLQKEQHFICHFEGRLLIHVTTFKGKFIFWDTLGGFISLKRDEIGQILVIEDALFEDKTEYKDLFGIRALVEKMVRDQNRYLLAMSLLSVMVVVFDLLIPQITEYLIDDVLPTKDLETLATALGALFLCTVFNLAYSTFNSIVTSVYASQIEQKLMLQFYRKVFNLTDAAVKKINIGGIMNRFQDLNNIRDFLIDEFFTLTQGIAKTILACGILFYYGWKVALIGLLVFPISLGLRWLFKKKIKRLIDESFELGSLSQSLITEVISSIITVKSSGSEKTFQKGWEKVTLDSIEKDEETELLATKMSLLIEFLLSIVRVCGIWVAVSLALKGEISAGAILAISMYLNMLMTSANSLAGLVNSFENVNVSIGKMNDVVSQDSEEPASFSRNSHTVKIEGKIEFDRVKFKYAENLPWVLDDLSFTIYPKQTVAIVGKSGCGKTTLAKIMAGLIKPSAGRVFYDGFDSNFISLKALRQQIGFLPQHNHLFAGSIKENMTLNSDFVMTDRLEEVTNLANAKEFIHKFPSNYDQYLAEGGLGLSGGEKQRLALARLLYSDPQVIIMDESTSALDAENEHAVMETVSKALKEKTVIVIAHRLSTVKNADYIYVMEEGKIIEQGAHSDLVNQNGFYYKLFENQISVGEAL